MKKILSLVVVALIAIGHVNAMKPNSPVGMSVIKKGAVVKVYYRGEQNGKVTVTIYNEKGHAVFKESMSDIENFMRPYNFSQLPAGNYTIQVADEQGIRVEKIAHGTERTGRVAHVTCLSKDENKFMFSVLNDGKNTLKIRIYDKYNNVLYREVASVTGNFARVYNLDQFNGEHTFEVSDMQGNITRLVK